ILLGGVQFLVAKRLPVRLGRILFMRRAKSNMCAANDQRRLWMYLGGLNSGIHRVNVVAVFDFVDMPAVRGKTRRTILRERQIGGAVNRNAIVVIKINQTPQLEMARQRRGLRSDAFHQIAVRDDGVNMMIE